MLVKFYPLIFDCSCMKSSKTVSDECLFMRLDPSVKYLARGLHLTVHKEEAQCCPCAQLLLSHVPSRVRVHTSTHSSTQTHISHSHTSLPSAHISFPLLFLSCGRSLTHTHVRAHTHTHTHTHTDTHRHTIPVVSLSRDLVKARGHGRPELC